MKGLPEGCWDDAGSTYGQDAPALLWRRPEFDFYYYYYYYYYYFALFFYLFL